MRGTVINDCALQTFDDEQGGLRCSYDADGIAMTEEYSPVINARGKT